MAMKKLVLILAMLALTAAPGLAHAGGFHAGFHDNRSRMQGQFFWRPFFYPGPFVYGYPGGFGYAYPGPYFTTDDGDATRYTYGYPGPYTYGVYGYRRPSCAAQLNGYWVCS
jgi:hypothetical protein